MNNYRTHQLLTKLITGAGPTAIAAAKTGYRVKVYAYALAGAANLFENSDGTDLTGVLPAGALSIEQPDFLVVSADNLGMSVFGGGTGFVVYAYERVLVKSVDSLT